MEDIPTFYAPTKHQHARPRPKFVLFTAVTSQKINAEMSRPANYRWPWSAALRTRFTKTRL